MVLICSSPPPSLPLPLPQPFPARQGSGETRSLSGPASGCSPPGVQKAAGWDCLPQPGQHLGLQLPHPNMQGRGWSEPAEAPCSVPWAQREDSAPCKLPAYPLSTFDPIPLRPLLPRPSQVPRRAPRVSPLDPFQRSLRATWATTTAQIYNT